ncbi:MAG TPA: ribonuclease J [Chloroflexota bacterium]
MAQPLLRVIPLGGVGEVGKNLTVFEYGDDIIVVDCGLMFPEDEMLGVDLVLPDISYLVERRRRIRGIVLTHGHEDHVGALPYYLQTLDVPVYGTPLTLGLVSAKLREFHLDAPADLREIRPREVLRLGALEVEFFHVCHSIPDGIGVAVHSPVGTVVHTGEFKFDPTPFDGWLTDEAKLEELGDRGVLALLSDCVRVESPGFTPSERLVGEAFDRIIAQAPGRVIMATFASNISRVQQCMLTAYRHGRKVALVGRSMEQNFHVAQELGYVDVPPGVLRSVEEINQLPHHEVVFITTGAQGEPTSALSRIANDDHRQIQLVAGDTVIISATPVPGNEEAVARTINNLFKQGARVIYPGIDMVHVSGHASQEDLKLMIRLTRPKYVVPIHGDYRHMVLFGQLAQAEGVPAERVLIPDLGSVLEFGDGWGRVDGTVPAGAVLVDGLGVGDVGHVVLRDRRRLSQEGILVVIAAVERHSGRLVAGPDIVSRGFVDTRGAADLIEGARKLVADALNHGGQGMSEWHFVHQKVRSVLGDYLYQQTGRRPLILPHVVEV